MTLEGRVTTFGRYEWKGKPYINMHGFNYEARTPIYRETDKYLVIKVPGRKCWVGRGEYRYTYPEFVIFQKEEDGTVLRLMKDIEYQRGGLWNAKMEVTNFLAYGK